MDVVAGIFVGGAARRMGGRAKGLLTYDGESLIARALRTFEACAVRCVLVGAHPAYAALDLPVLRDVREGAGPLAGVAALLAHAQARAPGTQAIAVACDMPYVTASMVRALVGAPPAVVIAPRREDRWEPFFARYDVDRARAGVDAALAAGTLSLQRVFDGLGAQELGLSDEDARALRDWDTPQDIER